MGQIKDLTGQRFGRLTVECKTDMVKNESVVWKCRCDCGNITYVRRNNLIQGITQSCGCLSRENIMGGKKILSSSNAKKRNFLVGRKYGRLTVVSVFKDGPSDKYMCECLCECGESHLVYIGDLKTGKTISCGCARDFALRENDDLCVDGTKLSTLYKSKSRSNKSGIKGVYFASRENKWCAEIVLRGKKKHIGYFDRLDDAAKARKAAEEQYFEPVLNKYGITLY